MLYIHAFFTNLSSLLETGTGII